MTINSEKYGNFIGAIQTHEVNPHNISDAHYILDYQENFDSKTIEEAEVFLRNSDEGDPIDFN